MGSLRRFEIDAVVAELQNKVNEKNKKIKVSNKEILKVIIKKYPEAIELNKIQKQMRDLEEKESKLQDKLRNDYDMGWRPNLDSVKDAVIKDLNKEKGFVTLDTRNIENKIIIAGSAGNLEEIIEKLTKDLGI